MEGIPRALRNFQQIVAVEELIFYNIMSKQQNLYAVKRTMFCHVYYQLQISLSIVLITQFC